MRNPSNDPHVPIQPPASTSSSAAHESLWNVRRTAGFLGLHEKTVYDMVARGELPVVRVGRLLRFDPRDMTRWVSARKEGC